MGCLNSIAGILGMNRGWLSDFAYHTGQHHPFLQLFFTDERHPFDKFEKSIAFFCTFMTTFCGTDDAVDMDGNYPLSALDMHKALDSEMNLFAKKRQRELARLFVNGGSIIQSSPVAPVKDATQIRQR